MRSTAAWGRSGDAQAKQPADWPRVRKRQARQRLLRRQPHLTTYGSRDALACLRIGHAKQLGHHRQHRFRDSPKRSDCLGAASREVSRDRVETFAVVKDERCPDADADADAGSRVIWHVRGRTARVTVERPA